MEQSDSMIEIEVKLPVASAPEALALLDRLAAIREEPREFEDNEVYDTPDGLFFRSHRLLRLRTVGDRGLITYKEKVASDLRAKVRAEIQTGVTSPGAARGILLKLGFIRVYRYQKHRTHFGWTGPEGRHLAISLDETPIGVFLELEGPGPAIDDAARRMGFIEADYIVDDYHALHEAWLAERGMPAGDMVFDAPSDGQGGS